MYGISAAGTINGCDDSLDLPIAIPLGRSNVSWLQGIVRGLQPHPAIPQLPIESLNRYCPGTRSCIMVPRHDDGAVRCGASGTHQHKVAIKYVVVNHRIASDLQGVLALCIYLTHVRAQIQLLAMPMFIYVEWRTSGNSATNRHPKRVCQPNTAT